MKAVWQRSLIIGLIAASAGCTSGTSTPTTPVVPQSQTAQRFPVTLRVTVPAGTARLQIHATSGDFSADQEVTSFGTAALKTKANQVASITVQLPSGQVLVQFKALDAQGGTLAQGQVTVDVSTTGSNSQDVTLGTGSSPSPSASPSSSPGVSPTPRASGSPPPFLNLPSPSPSPGASGGSPSPSPTASSSASPTPAPTPTPTPGPNGGVVTTLAGQANAGLTNGSGTAAQLNFPSGLAVSSNGLIYVADFGNNAIRSVTTTGTVLTLAGNGNSAYVDGTGTGAQFYGPTTVATDSQGNVFVADCINNLIRKITPGGVVTTVAGDGSASFNDGTGTGATFNGPQGVVMDATGNLYVADSNNNRIRKIAAGNVVTTFAGSGSSGGVDGTGIGAQFKTPTGIAIDASGNLIVADTLGHSIRKITSSGVVTTIAGNGTAAFVDGTGANAQFNRPYGVTVGFDGTIYVADFNNNRIRKIASGGVVTTLAGNGTAAFVDGTGSGAQFYNPYGVTVDSSNTIYVGDANNNRIRKIR